jgi:membrane fusion protein (multidrug efflux system)
MALLSPLLAQKPVAVTVEEARVEVLSDRIEALGTLRANESVNLTAKVSELITSVDFVDGQRVKKGQILVTMEQIEEAALLNEAQSTAEESRRQYERTQQLSKQGAASLAQLDEALRVYETARARELAFQSRRDNLIIAAPFDGVVGLRNISVGALVQPGDLIITIDDDSVMKLDFSVPSTFLGAIKPGTLIEAHAPAFGNRKFRGEVRSIDSRIDPVTRTIVVRAEIPNSDLLLKPGLLMSVEILSRQREALVIPEEALLPQGRQSFVMVVEESPEGPLVRRKEVAIGTRHAGTVEIIEGLSAGQKIVTHGGLKLTEGAAVEIKEKSSAGN